MDANALTPRALFDPTVSYEVPPFQRPYVWTEEDQWQPLWDDIVRVAEPLLEGPADQSGTTTHFLGAVVLKQRETSAGGVAKHLVIDGQQRLTTLQLLLHAAHGILQRYGEESDAESIRELVINSARRFRGTPSRFKLWPSRIDREAFQVIMDAEGQEDAAMGASARPREPLAWAQSRLHQAHAFFRKAIQEWADTDGDPDKVKARLSVLAQVLQQQLQIVSINLAADDDDQLIFETLNNRGTPLLAADLIKNFVFQRCEDMGMDVDAWTDKYWQDFDEDWWRSEVAQGRLYRSRIDMFLQYWLTRRLRDEVPADNVFSRFRSFAQEHLAAEAEAESFLQGLRNDATTYRRLVEQDSGSVASEFYTNVVEALELGSFLPLLLWLVSDNHPVPTVEVKEALNAVESFAVRRTLLRKTSKDLNKLVVALLRELDGKPMGQIGRVVVGFLSEQTADSRSWPTDEEVLAQLPSMRLYSSIKQPRLRLVLSALEKRLRGERHEQVSLPSTLEIEHLMPRGWRIYWDDLPPMDYTQRATERDLLVDTIGNLTLVTKKLNGTLSNRPWRDSVALTGEIQEGKRSLINRFSILVMNKHVVDNHPDRWTEDDIRERGKTLTAAVIAIWPGPVAARALAPSPIVG